MFLFLSKIIDKYRHKKRYKFILGLSIFLHIIGSSWVGYMLVFDLEKWLESMRKTRILIGLNDYKHDHNLILNLWMVAIQIRYILTDCWVLYYAYKYKNLIKYTIINHGIDGFICSVVFLSHKGNDCFIFGITCVVWTIMWFVVFLLHNSLHKIK